MGEHSAAAALRRFALLAALAVWSGAGPAAARAGAEGRLPEEFNPQSLGEELLLIQPLFPPPDTLYRTPGDHLAAALPDPPPLHAAYSLQIAALRDSAAARRHAAELKHLLGVPVYVVPLRDLFVVRAGDYEKAAAAEALKKRLLALEPAYADAYVAFWEGEAEGNPGPPLEEAPAMERIFGWRVLLDQFLQLDQAEKLKRKALRRLGRRDVEVIFKAPWYKIVLGNFRREAEAQALAESVQNRGFRNALEVRGEVLVPRKQQ